MSSPGVQDLIVFIQTKGYKIVDLNFSSSPLVITLRKEIVLQNTRAQIDILVGPESQLGGFPKSEKITTVMKVTYLYRTGALFTATIRAGLQGGYTFEQHEKALTDVLAKVIASQI